MSRIFLLMLVLVAPAQLGATAQTSSQEIASRRFLIGTWHCSFTVGNRSGTYTTVWATALDNRWLTQTIDQPPSKTYMTTGKSQDSTDKGFHSQYLVGYDERRHGWVRFGAMTTGQYFAIAMRDTPNAGWDWKYVSFFSPRRTPTAKPDAHFAKRSDTRYTIDGPTYPGASGVIETEHHICTKQT